MKVGHGITLKQSIRGGYFGSTEIVIPKGCYGVIFDKNLSYFEGDVEVEVFAVAFEVSQQALIIKLWVRREYLEDKGMDWRFELNGNDAITHEHIKTRDDFYAYICEEPPEDEREDDE